MKILYILLGLLIGISGIAYAATPPATVPQGGTGITTAADGALIMGNSTLRFTTLATSTGGTILQTSFTTGRPSWVATSTLGFISLNNQNWNLIADSPNYLIPTTTGTGIIVNATSTIGNGNQNGGLTISGGSTTTLNAYFASNIGIGTTSPGSLLSLANVANFTTATSTFYSTGGINLGSGCFALTGTCLTTGSLGLTGTTGQVAYFSGTNTAVGTSTLFISTARNVGIANIAPTRTLDVTGTGAISTSLAIGGATIGADALGVTGTASFSSTVTGQNLVTNGVLQLNTNGGTDLFASGGGEVRFRSVGNHTNAFFLTATGAAVAQLGQLDAAAPVAQTLQVQGVAAGTSNTAGANFTINASRGTGTGASGTILFNVFPAGSTGTTQNFATTTALTILGTNGNVGIGTTSPFAKLSVHANNGETNTTLFAIASSTAVATTTLFSVSNTGAITGGSGNFNVTSGGNMTVAFNGVAGFNFYDGGNAGFGSSVTVTSQVVATYFQGTSATASTFLGNVGIGTTTPFAQLTVATPNGATGATRNLFMVASSTATATTTAFRVDNVGHIFASSTNPVLSSCGTGPTMVGSDQHGTVTAGSAANGCTVTFGVPYPSAPTCTVADETQSVVNAFAYTVSATAITVTETGLGGTLFDFICFGNALN